MDYDIKVQKVIEGSDITCVTGGQPAGNDGRGLIHASLSTDSGDGHMEDRLTLPAHPTGTPLWSAVGLARTRTWVTSARVSLRLLPLSSREVSMIRGPSVTPGNTAPGAQPAHDGRL